MIIIKKVEYNVETNHVNNIFHSDIPEDYIISNGYEIIEKECEELSDGGWQVVGQLREPTDSERIEQLENIILMMLEVN